LRTFENILEFAVKNPTPLAQDFAKTETGFFHSDMYLSAWFPQFRKFVHESDIGKIGAALLSSEKVFLFNDEILIKSPMTERETPWHHDLSYWPLAGTKVCSVWIALDPTTRHNGGMEFSNGSHLQNVKYHPRNFDTGADRPTNSGELSAQNLKIDPDHIVSFDVEPGDIIAFHARTLHRAFGNSHPTRSRRALVYRLIGDDVTYDPRPRTIPLVWAPDLTPGEPFRSSELFPQLL
jgi:ectoine hydroxylase-related dioxygenase (phytanoyl-CoA dioxygenase family)